MRLTRQNAIVWLLAGVFLLVWGVPAAAQDNYPGSNIFSYQCGGSTISFSWQGNPVFQVSLSAVASPLSIAVNSGQNQIIQSGAEVSLWALHSDELQIHVNSNPDGTKLVVNSGVCGPIPVAVAAGSGTTSAEALAYVQVNGPGQGLAYAQVTSTGQVLAFAQLSGSGQALAFAQSTTGSGSPPPNSSGNFHIVAAGENLFRIALRYGTTVAVLSSINGISNPALIYVGQKIYLP